MIIANVRTISEKTKTEFLVMCQKSDCVNLILKKGGTPCVGCVTLTFYIKKCAIRCLLSAKGGAVRKEVHTSRPDDLK